MAGLLDAVQQALRREASMVYIEGFRGLGGIVTLLMSLCPNDTLLLVENGIIYQGERRSVVVSVLYQRETTFNIEKVIRDIGTSSDLPVSFRDEGPPVQASRMSSYDHMTMKTQGCLADMVNQVFATVTFQSTREVVAHFTSLIAAIMCSFTGNDFGTKSQIPKDGLQSLLGPHFKQRIRKKLALLFGIQPTMDNLDPILAYNSFRQSINGLVLDSACTCSQCPRLHNWAAPPKERDTCPIRNIWGALRHLVSYAVLLNFVKNLPKTLNIIQSPRTTIGPYLCHQLVRHVLSEPDNPPKVNCSSSYGDGYSSLDLHNDLCQMLGSIPSNAGDGHNYLGTSSGATSILPVTLGTISFSQDRKVRYWILDGQFHDGRNYYKSLIEDARIPARPVAQRSILHPGDTISPSGLGVHTHVTLSVRPYHNSLAVRTMMKFPDRIINLSFCDPQIAYMSTSIASSCGHDKSLPATEPDADYVLTTGLEAPIAIKDQVSMVLTHGNSEAQFLAGVPYVQSLFQGSSCLDCMIKEAKGANYRLLIQS